MKRIYTFAAALLFLGACTSDGYTIRGNVEGLESPYVYLITFNGTHNVADSAKVEAGAFTFTGKTELPEVAYLSRDKEQPFVRFFLENARISIDGNLYNPNEVYPTGTAANEAMNTFNELTFNTSEAYGVTELEADKKQLVDRYKQQMRETIDRNRDNICGMIILAETGSMFFTPQEVLAVTMAPDKDEVARNNGEQQRAFTWGELWTTRSLWGVLLIRLISDPVWYFCCFWLPGYLRSMGEAQGLSQQATLDMIQYIGGLPFLFGAVGGILTSVWSDWLVRRGMPALKARKTMMILMAFVAPLCILTPYVSEWQAVSFDARIGLVVAIFSLIAIMCLSWLYTICVVIAEAFPVKNVASVVGITAGAGAVGGAVFNIFIGSLLATMGNVLFAVMGVMHLVTAVILWRMVRHETPKNVK